MNFIKLLKIVFIVYANLTSMEWFVHKYVMHGYDRVNVPIVGRLINGESQSHWAHHHEVMSDMSLDIENKDDKHKGLFFHHDATFLFTVVLFVLLTLQFKLFRVKMKPHITLATVLICTVGYSFLWNNFHSLLHGADDIILSGTDGVTNRYQNKIVPWVPRIWIQWMMLNHAQHHAVKGNQRGTTT